ncbi:MAG: transcriptional regulator TetR family [Stygiobacter sp.]|nr:MAG: transcriptional regulator TetR family [Stygiobacter sp.]KAF0217529.1 MAG: transcriptional regulator TetR [Ignavibacteria bacterium]
MNEEKEIKQRIVQRADEMFRQYGYSKVTMEEIASNLAISKKTLYKHFSNKDHVLKEIVHTHKCEVDGFIDNLMAQKTMPFLEKLESFMNFIAKQAEKIEGPMVRDLMRCNPEIWKDIEEFRANKAYKHLSGLIKEGVESGVFRKDINNEVIVLAYVASIHSLINPEVLAKLPVSADQAFRGVLKILFEGIFTTEGREKYKSTIDNYGETTV